MVMYGSFFLYALVSVSYESMIGYTADLGKCFWYWIMCTFYMCL